ncbi:hypothetical protein EGW08_010576 [Elysia chlorotica]|uniref:Protein quiver n=1 Tax=Elysia chlorotica TaxID=188477 RepID=A0A3S1B7J5_ELYCH|nr:hypothetical protein EGW08_010576 [Elysia chlorotica]
MRANWGYPFYAKSGRSTDMRKGAEVELDQVLPAITMWTLDIRLLILATLFSLARRRLPVGDSLLCYRCDNLSNPPCNQYFMAYQFRAITCPMKSNGDRPMCGKQPLPVGDSLLCYRCDNLSNPACNQYFMAYQFRAITCPMKSNGDRPMCGKQQQPPLRNGWVGVLRSCYYPGDLPDMNETLGCHHHMIVDTNFSAIYCLCDRDLCNGAKSTLSGRHFRGSGSHWWFSTHALSYLLTLLTSSVACPILLAGCAFARVLLEW